MYVTTEATPCSLITFKIVLVCPLEIRRTLQLGWISKSKLQTLTYFIKINADTFGSILFWRYFLVFTRHIIEKMPLGIFYVSTSWSIEPALKSDFIYRLKMKKNICDILNLFLEKFCDCRTSQTETLTQCIIILFFLFPTLNVHIENWFFFLYQIIK